jgi:hypothetical protein
MTGRAGGAGRDAIQTTRPAPSVQTADGVRSDVPR